MPLHHLYIVPTPIGNLEDITLRALRILREVRLIAAEDTRTTRKLLDHFQIDTPMISYHEYNKLTRLDAIFSALEFGDVALVSDAGTPGISDPGYELICKAIEEGVPVVPLPGPSAVVAALVASGLPTDSFIYLGFLPRKTSALRSALETLITEPRTLIAYESPNRLTDLLSAIHDVLGERSVVVARELSKFYEEFRRGPVSEVLAHFEAHEPRGEITVVIGGAQPQPQQEWTEDQIITAVQERIDQGEPRSAAVRVVAALSGWDRRAIYDLSLRSQDDQ